MAQSHGLGNIVSDESDTEALNEHNVIRQLIAGGGKKATARFLLLYVPSLYVRAAIGSSSPGAQACRDTACLLCLPSPQCKLQQTGVTLKNPA